MQPARSHCDQREKYDIDDFHAFQESEPAKSISSRLRRHRRAVVRARAGIKARTDLRIQTRRSHFTDDENSEEHRNNEKHNASLDKTANCLVPNTIAFGGVATRSTKAKEHAQVARISNVSGCVSADRATALFDAMSGSPHGERGFADTFRDGSINTNEEIDCPFSLQFCHFLIELLREEVGVVLEGLKTT